MIYRLLLIRGTLTPKYDSILVRVVEKKRRYLGFLIVINKELSINVCYE